MKNTSKAILLAVLGVAAASNSQAAQGSYGLILGITQQGANAGGNDLIYALDNPTTFTFGQTWDLSSALTGNNFNINTIKWGAVGSLDSVADGANPQHIYVTTLGLMPDSVNGGSAFDALNTPVGSIMSGFTSTVAYPANASFTISSANDNSWNGQTIVAPNGNSLFNAYGLSPNQTGVGSLTLWDLTDDNATPSVLGYLNLSDSGVLSFTASPVPEPSSLALIGGGALLLLSLRNKLRSNKL